MPLESKQRPSIARLMWLTLPLTLASMGAIARTTSLTDATREALKGQAVTLAVHRVPGVGARTAGKAAFAVFGAKG